MKIYNTRLGHRSLFRLNICIHRWIFWVFFLDISNKSHQSHRSNFRLTIRNIRVLQRIFRLNCYNSRLSHRSIFRLNTHNIRLSHRSMFHLNIYKVHLSHRSISVLLLGAHQGLQVGSSGNYRIHTRKACKTMVR